MRFVLDQNLIDRGINTRKEWRFCWEDVQPHEGPLANFWLTHYQYPYIRAVKLNEDGPVNIQERNCYDVPPHYDIICADKYRIWPMKPGQNPEYDTDPITESPDVRTKCTDSSDT